MSVSFFSAYTTFQHGKCLIYYSKRSSCKHHLLQQSLAAQVAVSPLCSIRQNTAIRSREMLSFAVQERQGHTALSPMEDHKGDSKTGVDKERLRELGLFSQQKKRLTRNVISVYKQLMGAGRETGRLFSVVFSGQTRGNTGNK